MIYAWALDSIHISIIDHATITIFPKIYNINETVVWKI